MDEEYGVLQLDLREIKTGKDDIILMGGDVGVDWEIDILHRTEWYVLTMKNSVKLREGSNEGVYWMLPQFQEIKDTSVDLTIKTYNIFRPYKRRQR